MTQKKARTTIIRFENDLESPSLSPSSPEQRQTTTTTTTETESEKRSKRRTLKSRGSGGLKELIPPAHEISDPERQTTAAEPETSSSKKATTKASTKSTKKTKNKNRNKAVPKDPSGVYKTDKDTNDVNGDNNNENDDDDDDDEKINFDFNNLYTHTDEKVHSLLRFDLISNTLLLLGGSFFTVFTARELIRCCQRDVASDFLYFAGSSGFVLSGFIQFLIDLLWNCRSIPTGRYCSTSRCRNVTITTLFFSGVVLDVLAFAFWREGGVENVRRERTVQWVSSHLWLLASIIVMASSTNYYNCTKALSISSEERMDLFGNIFFLLESIMNVCARYVADIRPTPGNTLDRTELKLELAGSFFWCCNAFFYLSGISVRNRGLRAKKRATRHFMSMQAAQDIR